MISSERDFLLDSNSLAMTIPKYFAEENVAVNSPQALDSVCLVAARPGVGWTPKRPLLPLFSFYLRQILCLSFKEFITVFQI